MHAASTNSNAIASDDPPQQPTPTALQTIDSLNHQLQELRAQLRHAQKLACLGTTSAMLAHEYNNVFASVVSYARYALDNDDVQLMRKALKTMLKQYHTVRAMSDRILGLARREDQTVDTVNLTQLLQDSSACLGRDLSKDNITLSLQADDSINVKGDRHALQQVFFNLVLNARQALLGQKGLIKITATPLPNSMVMIHVRDNGRGIRRENLQKVFDPFFSTKYDESRQERKGIGLGLAICKDIVAEHGGLIEVESIEGHGTTFTVTLPTVS